MSIKVPRSLRAERRFPEGRGKADFASSGALTAAALLAAGTSTTAEAQQADSNLPPVTVDAPRVRQRPVAAPTPTAAQVRARTALRRQARQAAARPLPPVAGPSTSSALPILAQAANANPYAQPGVPYKANNIQSSKVTEPIANTPRSITVLTKEVLADKGATSLRELGRSTAGITLGTGEGGNAFGDRFFIRGFDARSDIFVDGIRDPIIGIRENFFTEQVEILRGPGSTFAGRGVAGGAINIVTKTANLDRDFRIAEAQGSPSDNTRRFTFDVNQIISPVLAVRLNGLYQNAGVAGRQFIVDNRWGLHSSVVFKPVEPLTFVVNYTHSDLQGIPDFGVPYNRGINRPATENLVPRYTFYGQVNRDFQRAKSDIATATGTYNFNENITLSTKFRKEHSQLNYIGTIPESPNYQPVAVGAGVNRVPALGVFDNPQSRYQSLGYFANQTEAAIKWYTGPVKHTSVLGMEFSHEQVTRDTYAGLQSESTSGTINAGGRTITSVITPYNVAGFLLPPTLAGNPSLTSVISRSAYAIHTANWNDYIILNGGVRADSYRIASNNATALRAQALNPGLGNPFTQTASTYSALASYNFGVVWKPIPIVSVYYAQASSYNPTGQELDANSAVYGGYNYAASFLGPEKNLGKEAGVKFELLDRKLLLSGALFETTKTNFREVLSGFVFDRGAQRIQGLDLQAAGKITDEWSVIGGATFMNTRVTNSIVPSNIGLPLAFLAHTSFSLLSKYQILPNLELGGQAVYNSKRYGGTFNAANGSPTLNGVGLPAPTPTSPFLNVPTELPAYWRFDAFTEVKFSDNLKGKFAVYNLFDRTYYDGFYQSGSPFVQVAPGRTVQFTMTGIF